MCKLCCFISFLVLFKPLRTDPLYFILQREHVFLFFFCVSTSSERAVLNNPYKPIEKEEDSFLFIFLSASCRSIPVILDGRIGGCQQLAMLR